MNSWVQWINWWIHWYNLLAFGFNWWIHGYNELTGEFMGTMNWLVNSLVPWINWWFHWCHELTGEFIGTMNKLVNRYQVFQGMVPYPDFRAPYPDLRVPYPNFRVSYHIGIYHLEVVTIMHLDFCDPTVKFFSITLKYCIEILNLMIRWVWVWVFPCHPLKISPFC